MSFAGLNPFKYDPLPFILQLTGMGPHLVNQELLRPDNVGDLLLQPLFVTEDAFEEPEGEVAQHPHNHLYAGRIGQNTHPVEPIEYVPTEWFDTLDPGRYDLQFLICYRVGVAEIKSVLHKIIYH